MWAIPNGNKDEGGGGRNGYSKLQMCRTTQR